MKLKSISAFVFLSLFGVACYGFDDQRRGFILGLRVVMMKT